MGKNRTKIPAKTAAQIEVASDRTCCVCRDPNKAYHLHHIDGDPTNHNPNNIVLLCLQHHHEGELKGGLGRGLSPDQLRLFRERWYAEVERRLKEGPPTATVSGSQAAGSPSPKDELVAAINEGMRLRTAIVLRPEHPLPFSSDPLFQWARRSHRLLHKHFVLFADEFYGEDPELGSSYFGMAFACATKDMDRGAYLESRLHILKEALRDAG